MQEDKYGHVITTLGKFHEGEPLFLLRATDPIVPQLIEEYARQAEQIGCSPDFVKSARDRAQAIRDWQTANPNLVKTKPD